MDLDPPFEDYAVVDKVFRDRPTALACFPDLGPFLQLAKESYESRHRKEQEAAAEAKRPSDLLRATYRTYIALQRCGAEQDYYGPLLNDVGLQRARDAARRAEGRLVLQLDAGRSAAKAGRGSYCSPAEFIARFCP
jgi:hypothetical protein